MSGCPNRVGPGGFEFLGNNLKSHTRYSLVHHFELFRRFAANVNFEAMISDASICNPHDGAFAITEASHSHQSSERKSIVRGCQFAQFRATASKRTRWDVVPRRVYDVGSGSSPCNGVAKTDISRASSKT